MSGSNLLAGIALVVSVSTTAALGLGWRPGGEPSSSTQDNEQVEPLDSAKAVDPSRVEKLEQSILSLQHELETLRGAPRTKAPDEAAVGAAVRAWLAENKIEALAAAKRMAVPASTKKAKKRSVKDLILALKNPKLSDDDMRKLWREAHAQGLGDELLAHFKELAKQNPNSPDSQFQLGAAYLFHLENLPDGQAKGDLAVAADQAFDRTLKLDEKHWDARFTKAIALSFWPPMFGKQPEAIKQFRTLIDQQEKGPSDPKHASSYLLLGNLLRQGGKEDEARKIYQRGLKRFPNNKDLLGSLR